MTTLRLMHSSLLAGLVIMSSLLSGCIIHIGPNVDDIELTLEENITLNVDSINALDVDVGSGSLKVYGKEDLNEIQANAEIFTSENLDYTFTLIKQGDAAKLVAQHDASSGVFLGKNPRINLVVYVPKALIINIEDTSGDLIVADLDNDLSLNDSSGDIIVRNIKGNVDIDDRSGDISINEVQGALWVDDSSGDIDINFTKGNVVIDDNSGGLFIQETYGDIRVEDNSGDINIVDTQGSISIDDGSGDISIERAYGLTIIDDGSGKTHIKDVINISNHTH
jgi:DUF4097 and DUF4098 domain-containing protein YvlB